MRSPDNSLMRVVMLLELAVADAYGIAWEFVDNPDEHGLVNDLSQYYQHPKYDTLKPSQYTDDTLRTIATARVITSCTYEDETAYLNPVNYVKALMSEYKDDPRDGFSRRFQQYLAQTVDASPVEFLRGIKKRAESNGSLMGVLPCGFLPTLSDVRLAATIQAITTHSVATAPFAQAMALAAHYFIYKLGDKGSLIDFIKEEVETDAFEPYRPLNPSYTSMRAKGTAETVLDLLMQGDSLAGILKAAVDAKGDTDSVAALSVGIASCSSAYEKNLPQHLVDGLEFGNRYVKAEFRMLEETLQLMVAQNV